MRRGRSGVGVMGAACALVLALTAPTARAVAPQPPGNALPVGEAFVEPDPNSGVGPLGWDVRNIRLGSGGGVQVTGGPETLERRLVLARGESWRQARGTATARVLGVVVTSGEVAAVSVNGGPPIPTAALDGLPVPAAIAAYEVPGATVVRRRVQPATRFTPLDANGAPLPRSAAAPEAPLAPGTWEWKGPAQDLQGICTIAASPFPGLLAASGNIVTQLRQLQYEGEADTVCAETVYTYNGGEPPLEAFMVIDAAHLGARPGPLPGLVPVAGSSALVSKAAHGETAAAPTSGGWLLVTGGRDQTQRLSLLSHLSGTLEAPKPKHHHHRHRVRRHHPG